jgi:PTS system ascorbate-specific IIB component
MFKAIVCCKIGVATSILLKIKVDEVIEENGFPIETENGTIDTLSGFDGDLIITKDDLSGSIKHDHATVIGIHDLTDKDEIKEKLASYVTEKWQA